jgi:NCS1 family nucleobase:cation symporter-1
MLASGAGYGVGDILAANADNALVNSNGGFLFVFCAGLTGNIAFWATLALNIPDFSRYATSQKAQFRGQLYGMPTAMFACAFIGAYFAQATALVFDEAIFNPIDVLFMLGTPAITLIAALCVMFITLTTTIVANVVAPANAFSNLAPGKITFNIGVIITIVLSIFYRPWWIFGGAGAYIFGWLNTYGTIIAPVAAIFVADYYIVKKRSIDVMSLFQGPEGRYWYQGGINVRAIIAWVGAFALPIIDQIWGIFGGWISANGYIVSFLLGLGIYILIMKGEKASLLSEEEHDALTQKA